MIDIAQNLIVSHTKEPTPILRWEVWFLTPLGLIATREEAIEKIKEVGLDPTLMIRATAVAIGQDTYEAIVWS